MSYDVNKTEEQWREELGDDQYKVLREAATERPWSGELLDEHRAGLYTCGACDKDRRRGPSSSDDGQGSLSWHGVAVVAREDRLILECESMKGPA